MPLRPEGNFDSMMSISAEGKQEMKWWLDNLDKSFSHVIKPAVDSVVYSDASLKGWGAALGSQKTGGNWSHTEANTNINILELRAAWFALRSFATQLTKKHV